MLQALIAKKAIDIILKKIMKQRELKNLRKYVEEDNELDIQVRQMQKTIAKQGRTIEKNETEIAILKAKSHKPLFSKGDYKNIIKRLNKLEKQEK